MKDDYKHGHSYGSKDFQAEVSLKVQDALIKKTFIFDGDEKIWFAKIQVIHELAKGVKDVYNYGFYEPPSNGRSGKFLDDERTFRDYPQRGSPVELEFKYKRRIYKSLQYDSKTLQKVHTKSNLKKLLDCVTSNNVSQVSKWTEKGLDPNFQDEKTGETPLTIAVTNENRRELITILVNGGAHLDYRAGDGLTPMHKAALAGKASNVKILLDLGCSPNVKDQKGLTPLYYSVLQDGDPNCTELLLNEHAQMGIADHQGMQEVHHACKNGRVQHLEHLVFYGANIDATTASGNTPLHITALSNHEECARVLLFRGARRDVLNYANQSAYEVAAVAGNKELAEFIRRFSDGQIVKFTEKPTYSTRRRKAAPKPRAHSLFEQRSPSIDAHSNKSDSSLPPSPGSLTGSRHSISNSGSLNDYGPGHNRTMQRSYSISSTTSDSSYTSEPEDMTLNERRSRAQENRSREMAPPVKIVSGAASVRKRLYAANSAGRRYIAVKDYAPCRTGELQLDRGDIVEVLYVGERGFWEGRVENRTGWFPSVCIEELKKGDKQRPKTLFGRPPAFSTIFTKSEEPRAPAIPDHRFIQQPRVVILNRGKCGFGFQMRGANCQTPRLNFRPTKEFPALQYIGDVEPGGEADLQGVKNDDFIIEVNDEDVTTATHSHVVNLIKRSGNCVKMKIVTVPMNTVNGVHSMDVTDGANRGKVPPPLPQRDPSTTLTLGRMRSSSRPSLFDSGLAYSQEEPTNFKVDSVIAVSKDSQWSTLQRRKPGASSSRSAAQFKLNSGSRRYTSSADDSLTIDKRSRSMQNIAAPYESATLGRAPRPRSTAIPFAIPQVPDRYGRSLSHSEETRDTQVYSGSSPIDNKTPARSMSAGSSGYSMRNHTSSSEESISQPRNTHEYSNSIQPPVRSMSVGNSGYDMRYNSSSSEETISPPRNARIYSNSSNPPARSLSVDNSQYDMRNDTSSTDFNESTIVARPVSTTVNCIEEPSIEAKPDLESKRERKHSLGSSAPLGLSIQRAVEARNERLKEQSNTMDRKISAPASVTSQRRYASTANDRLRSDIMSQLNSQLGSSNDIENINKTDYGNNAYEHYPNNIVDAVVHENVTDTRNVPYRSKQKTTDFIEQRIAPSSNTDGRNSRQPTSPSKKKDSPKKIFSKPPIPTKPTAPPPPPVPPAAPPLPTSSPGKPVKPAKLGKSKSLDIPDTAVRQGLITVDALQAKKGKLKTISNNQDTPKSSKTIDNLVGRLAGPGGRPANKPTPTFGGNQHAHMLAKAVAARAAKLANEASDNELDSSSAWEDDVSSPAIPRTSNTVKVQASPKKTPPPVAPKKASVPRKFTQRSMDTDISPGRRIFPPRFNDPDRVEEYSTEEDRTMMIFDDIIRKELESENWSLNSWNSSDSSSLAEGVLPPGTTLSNSSDDRPRKASFGSRPWYEYSSGSPSEESLNASSERISHLRSTNSLDEGSRLEASNRRYSNEDSQSVNSTLTRDIHLVPMEEKRHYSASNSSLASDEISHESYSSDNRSSNDEIKDRYTPTNGIDDDSTLNHSTSEDSDVVEKTITTSSGVKIKLLLNTSPSKQESLNLEEKQPIENTIDDELTQFLPPPPMDFTTHDGGVAPSPPLPPPPEFVPICDGDFENSLPAPPLDFCDETVDHGSSKDKPATSSKQIIGATYKDKPLLEWNGEDVCDWLISLNLPQYQETFRDNDIKGLHLPELTKADLLELGIKSLGHRMTMENSVAKLCHPMESSC